MFRPSVYFTVLILFLSNLNLISSGRTTPSVNSAKSSVFWCSVCEIYVDEINNSISSISNSDIPVQTSWRIDSKSYIPSSRSESTILEILEGAELMNRMKSYGLCNYTNINNNDKDRVRLVKLSSIESMGLNSAEYYYSNYTESVEISSAIEKLTQKITEEFLEEILLFFHRNEANIKDKLCVKLIKACPNNTDWTKPTNPPILRKTQNNDNISNNNNEIQNNNENNENNIGKTETAKSDEL